MFSFLLRINTNFPIQHFIKIIIENKSNQVKSVSLFIFNKSNKDTNTVDSTFRIWYWKIPVTIIYFAILSKHWVSLVVIQYCMLFSYFYLILSFPIIYTKFVNFLIFGRKLFFIQSWILNISFINIFNTFSINFSVN